MKNFTNYKLIKILLTNYLFKFLFENNLNIKDGELLECQGDLFIYSNNNGNPNNLKYYFKQDGFWNYIKAYPKSIYNLKQKKFVNINSQGYDGFEYYKNSIRIATIKEKNLYKNL